MLHGLVTLFYPQFKTAGVLKALQLLGWQPGVHVKAGWWRVAEPSPGSLQGLWELLASGVLWPLWV